MFSTRKPQSKRRLSSLIAATALLWTNVLFPYTAQTSQLPEFPELRSCLPELTLQSEPTAQDTDIIPFNVSETKKTISKQHNQEAPGWLRSIVGNYGKIKEVYLPTTDELAPVVIHIQDIHQHYEAQKNIAYIIRNVAAYRYRHHLLNNDPRTSGDKPLTPAVIGLEGASGNFNFSPYRAYSDKELTKDIAEYFMKSGMIGGPEFYGITAHEDLTLPMTGVENTKLYSANIEAFKSSLGLAKEANETIVKARMTLRHRKDRTLNPACLAFDKKREEYQEGKISLGQYIGFLGKLTQRALPVNSAMYVKAQSIEKSLDFAAVEKERSKIMELMSKNMPKTKTDDLLQLGLAYRKGSISFAEFYARFWKVAQNCGINMSEYPSLNKYVEYVTLVDKIVKTKLHAETSDMENSLENILAKTENEKALLESSHYLDLVKKLVNRTLTSEEWQEYKNLGARDWGLGTSNDNKLEPAVLASSPKPLVPVLKSFEQFYEIAQQRNEALVENLLTKIREPKTDDREPKNKNQKPMSDFGLRTSDIGLPSIAVLIAGGFHTKGISQLLKEKNIPFVAIMPDITKSGSGRTALEMLVREKTPLEKLFAGEKISLRNPVSVGLSNPNDTSGEAISLLFGAAEITGSLLGKRNDHAIGETDFPSFEVSKQPNFSYIDDREAIEFEVTIETPQGNKRRATVIGIQTEISDAQEKLKNNDQYRALIGTAKQIASIELSDGTKLDIHVQVEDSLRDSFQTVVSQVKESFNKIFEPNIANQAQTVDNTFQQGIKAVVDLALSEKTTEPQREMIVNRLVAALGSNDPEARSDSKNALTNLHLNTNKIAQKALIQAIPSLAKHLTSANADVLIASLDILQSLTSDKLNNTGKNFPGTTIASLVPLLKHDNSSVVVRAQNIINRLAEIGVSKESLNHAIQPTIDNLGHSNSDVRIEAQNTITTLAKAGMNKEPLAKAVKPTVTNIAQEGTTFQGATMHNKVSIAAQDTLRALIEAGVEIKKDDLDAAVTNTLSHINSLGGDLLKTTQSTLSTLTRTGARTNLIAQEAIPISVNHLLSNDLDVQQGAARLLSDLAHQDNTKEYFLQVIPTLFSHLKATPTESVAANIISVLGALETAGIGISQNFSQLREQDQKAIKDSVASFRDALPSVIFKIMVNSFLPANLKPESKGITLQQEQTSRDTKIAGNEGSRRDLIAKAENIHELVNIIANEIDKLEKQGAMPKGLADGLKKKGDEIINSLVNSLKNSAPANYKQLYDQHVNSVKPEISKILNTAIGNTNTKDETFRQTLGKVTTFNELLNFVVNTYKLEINASQPQKPTSEGTPFLGNEPGLSFFGKVELEPILKGLFRLGTTKEIGDKVINDVIDALNNILPKMGFEKDAARELTNNIEGVWRTTTSDKQQQKTIQTSFVNLLLPFMGINEVAKAVSSIMFGEKGAKTSIVSLDTALGNIKKIGPERAQAALNVVSQINENLGLKGENALKTDDIQVVQGILKGGQKIDTASFMAITTDLNGRLKVMVHANTLKKHAKNIDNFLAAALNHEVLEFNGFSHDDVVKKAKLSLEGTKDKSPIEITAMAKNFAERNGVKLTVQKSAEIRSAIKTELVSALKKSNVADQLSINNGVKINNKEISSIEELIPEIESNLTAAFELRDQIGEISDKYNNLLSAVSLLNWAELFSNNTRNDYQNMPLTSENMRSDDFMNMSAQQQAVVELMDSYQKLYQSFSKIENMPNAISTEAKTKEMLPVIQEHLAVFVNKFFETASILSNPKESSGKLGMDLTTMQRAVKELVGLFKADSNKPGAAKLTEALQRNVARTKYLVSQKPQAIQPIIEPPKSETGNVKANVFIGNPATPNNMPENMTGILVQQLIKVNERLPKDGDDENKNAGIVIPLVVNNKNMTADEKKTYVKQVKQVIAEKLQSHGIDADKVFKATSFGELVIARNDLLGGMNENIKQDIDPAIMIDPAVVYKLVQNWMTEKLKITSEKSASVNIFTDRINLFKDNWTEEAAQSLKLYLILSDTQVMEVPRIEEIIKMVNEADKQA